MPVSARAYERVALADPAGFWELHDGCLGRKPDAIMTIEHNEVQYRLNLRLIQQRDAWRRQPDGTYTETRYTGGSIQPVALPGVSIDLDWLRS